MVGNYKDQEGKARARFPLVQFHSNNTENLCIFETTGVLRLGCVSPSSYKTYRATKHDEMSNDE